jgi:hypothetical protein
MLQNPAIAFRDPALKKIAIKRNAQNQPKSAAGQFAVVYSGTFPNGQGSRAIRVFKGASAERNERYQAISDYLKGRQLGCLVGFDYCNDGIRSTDGKWYPLVTMEWVTGNTLYNWAADRCSSADSQKIGRTANLWVDLISELTSAKIAHGDLQHANVMVTDQGALKLVDYDCMCVPALVGRNNLEIGVDPYQHPGRNIDTLLSPNLDNFSGLFILVALKALAANPGLWSLYVEQAKYDKLLLRREDLDNPGQSPLIQALKRSSCSEVQRLVGELLELVRVPMDQVPRLDQVLFSFANVERLLDQKDFDSAVELLTRGKKQVGEAPPALQPRLQDAQARVQRRLELEKAVQASDEGAMQKLYAPRLLDDYPRAQPAVAVARDAARVVPLLAQLEQTQQTQAWRRLVQVWDANSALLAKRKSAARFASSVQTWRERNRACDGVLALLAAADCDGAALSAAWANLVAAGGHPEVDAQRPKVEGILHRQRAWADVEKVPRSADFDSDQKLLAAWNDQLFTGWARADREKPRVAEARARLTLAAKLQTLLSEPLSEPREERILQLAGTIPAGYQYPQRPQVVQADQRLSAARRLQALLQPPVSDLTLAENWQLLCKLQGQPLVPPAAMPRILLAEQRVPALMALKKVPPNYSPQQAPQCDPQLLGAWKDELLRDCEDARPWLAQYETAARRRTVLAQLKMALGANDRLRIAELFEDPSIKNYPLPADLARAGKAVLEELHIARGLIDALDQNNRGEFRRSFDVRVIRQNASVFEPRQVDLRSCIESEVLALDVLGLGLPVGRRPIQREPGSATAYRVCWKYPAPRFSDQCLVMVCGGKPQRGQNPQELRPLLRLPVDRKSFEEGGGNRVIHAAAQWLGAYVVVWAVVDPGFEVFYSEPLILGRLDEPAPKPAARRLGGFFS